MGLFDILGKDKKSIEQSKKYREIGLSTNNSNYGWYTCVHCGKKFRKGSIDIDHIVPQSKGGTNDPKNLQCLCIHCNRSKGNRMDKTKEDLKKRKASYGRYKRSIVLNEEIKKNRQDAIQYCKALGMSPEEIRQVLKENGVYN